MRAALIKVQQMGIHLVLASGRPTYGVLSLAKELELDKNEGYILSYNGGQIINVQIGELLFEKRVNPEMIPYLERKAKKIGFDIFTYCKDTIYTNNASNERIIQEAELNNMQCIREVENFAEAVCCSPCKCMIVSDDKEFLIELERKSFLPLLTRAIR
jgi:hydroxymethylpyrimidine pyrophosphatase-like HAD family hydrolase